MKLDSVAKWDLSFDTTGGELRSWQSQFSLGVLQLHEPGAEAQNVGVV